MIHETFLHLTETAFGSHPCRIVSATYHTLRPFHGGNAGSNPAGDAKKRKGLDGLLVSDLLAGNAAATIETRFSGQNAAIAIWGVN